MAWSLTPVEAWQAWMGFPMKRTSRPRALRPASSLKRSSTRTLARRRAAGLHPEARRRGDGAR
eukprot:11165979-Lingulodinium_polyedra.AAC.1